MNSKTPAPEEVRLSSILRAARPAPTLPPGFQDAVWRRLERAEAHPHNFSLAVWLDNAVTMLLRPRLALAGALALLLMGMAIGVVQGESLANQRAKQQYLASVSPLAN